MMDKKKILILGIAAVMLVAAVLVPFLVINKKDEPIQTVTEITAETTTETTTQWMYVRPKAEVKFDSATGELTIVSCKDGNLFSNDLPEGIEYVDSVKTIVIEQGTEYIGTGVFEKLYSLRKVVLPSSLAYIDEGAFRDCSALKEINLENVVEIEREAFMNCSSLESIVLSEKNKSLPTNSFGNCTSLKYITLNNPETCFYSSFEGCTAIQEVTAKHEIPCSEINEFKGTPYYERQTEYFEGITYYRNEVVGINPEYKGVCHIREGVKEISYAGFNQNTGITEIVLPDSFETVNWEIFRDGESLRKISFGKGVREISFDEMTGYLTSIEEYYVDPENKYFSSDEYGALFNKDKTKMYVYPSANRRSEYTVPDSVKDIEHAFYFCDYLKSVKIGKSVLEIKNCIFFSEYLGEFRTCKNLEKLIVSKDNPNYSSDENGILYDKNKKTLLLVPPACKMDEFHIPDSVTTVRTGAFYCATGIKKLYIGTNVKTLEEYSLCDVNPEGDFYFNTEIHYEGTEKQWKALSEKVTGGRFGFTDVYIDGKPLKETKVSDVPKT